ncbi:CBS domain-containing protein [Halovivax gelatinilyticus]|uniref:CBS domain-containing protein n=1 Tax=Halovivax gelatinilyticus TaxID=2961597 RepID=UPI0020CA8AC8|nr:CBS domain-containing protein [Halovivax gelatinilyticus]
MEVREIMSSPVLTAGPDDSLRTAAGLMLDHRVGSVVVMDEGLAGIVTESDVLRATYVERERLDELVVADVMSTDLATITSTTSVTSALRTMEEENVKRLPIRGGKKPLGIVTLTDIAWHLPDRLRERPGVSTRSRGGRRGDR